MALTINLPKNKEQEILHKIELEGLSIENYFLQLHNTNANLEAPNNIEPDKLSEKELLRKINLNISEPEWLRYSHLIKLRDKERLTEEEYQELCALGEKIESAGAERLEYLAALSKLRGVSLKKLMNDLNIKPRKV